MNIQYILNARTDGANPFKIYESLSQINEDALAYSLTRMSYASFLKTAYWFAVSMVAKSNAGMRCQVCNSPERIQVHHRTYDTHGKEHKNMNDLVVLCHHCHGLFHGHKPPEFVHQLLKVERPKKVKRMVIPHTQEDLQMPDGETIILTVELVNACRANGSFTNSTLNALGVPAPLVSGWIHGLVGKPISRESYQNALKGRFIYREKRIK